MSPPPPHHHDLDHHDDLDQHHFSNIPSTPGKINLEKCPSFDRIRSHDSYALAKFAVSVLICSLLVIFIFKASSTTRSTKPTQQIHQTLDTSWGGSAWENRIHNSARIRSPNGISVLVTGAAGFIGTHVTSALKRRGDGVLGLDSFNDYYDTSLKRARQSLLERNGVFIVEGDINDRLLLTKLFDIIPFTHVMHLAAQAGVRYAMQNPESYINSNIAGFVNLLEVCKSVNPQPAIVWASSSSVYGLNTKVPFSEKDTTDQPASLYAATKKAGEEIAHTYNHIYGLSLTALRFFTVYGPWGRPDMAYFFFTKDILSGKPIQIFEKHESTVARDFTYIDDIVKGCLGALDTAEKSTGSGGKKRAAAQLRVFNLGNTSPVTVSEMVEILETALKVEAEKVVVTMPGNGDVPYTHANISLAREQLGYKPTTDLKTGLEKFVHWYLAYYKPHQGQRSSQR